MFAANGTGIISFIDHAAVVTINAPPCGMDQTCNDGKLPLSGCKKIKMMGSQNL